MQRDVSFAEFVRMVDGAELQPYQKKILSVMDALASGKGRLLTAAETDVHRRHVQKSQLRALYARWDRHKPT